MKQKHLIFEERVTIEELLNKGSSIHQIALKLGRPDSTIVREIQRNRYKSDDPIREVCIHHNRECPVRLQIGDCPRYIETNEVCHSYSCSGCSYICSPELCDKYVAYICPSLLKSPFVCNGCTNAHCRHNSTVKYKYQAKRAQVLYEDNLTDSRVGIALTAEEMQKLDNLVSPLLFQGQSIRAIFMAHKDEIPCSESTLYDYVDRCYLTARNIDMPRKVRFKVRYNHGPRTKSFQDFVTGRTYIDFQKYIEEYPNVTIWEMDTVIGSLSDTKCLLTLLCRKSTLMIAILLEKHTQEAVIEALNDICDKLGIELFQKIFNVIITDRGPEFGNPYAIECDQNGEIKTKVFYCDPYCSWQKGMIERNHEFIRTILPKGRSFQDLSQMDITLMMNHINNYPRESLNGTTPFELSKLLLGEKFLKAFKYHKIRQDDVILKPLLLRKPYFNRK